MKEKIDNHEEKSLDVVDKKEHFGAKFVNVIKKKWLISGAMTFLLVAILIMAFVLSTYGIQKLELTPIDFTTDKKYTVTDESKEKIKKVEKNVNVYLIGYTDDAPATVIAKQYNKTNEKINVEAIDIKQRKDLAQKYGIDDSTSQGIIVECGEKYKVLSPEDLTSYDMTSSKSSDVTEQKLTASIVNTASDENTPNVYFLTGYSQISLDKGMSYFKAYVENENVKLEELNILSKGSVPDDCNTLIIATPDKDFEDVTTDAIIKYINKGGNILWFNASYAVTKELPNVNKVLATYGVDPFSSGYIIETDANKMFYGTPYIIIPEVGTSKITSKTASVMLVQSTKINIANSEKLEELKVEKEDLLTASKKSYFRSDLTIMDTNKTEKDQTGEFTVGAQFTKTVENDKKSKLVLFGENYFVTDVPMGQNSQTPLIRAADNKDLALNSLADLTEREDDITVRKTSDEVNYTPTEQQDIIIKIIIFAVPCLIILVGIIVWQVRRRKK